MEFLCVCVCVLCVLHKVLYLEKSKMRFLQHRNSRKIAFCDCDSLNLKPVQNIRDIAR